eukprot:749581-Hanusia_phi.AAC.2
MSAASPKNLPSGQVITAENLREFLHLPVKEVAKQFGICLSSLKKVCRQHGIIRWPYRRMQMIDKKIKLLELKSPEDSQDRMKALQELKKLQRERDQLPHTYGNTGVISNALSWTLTTGSPHSKSSLSTPEHSPRKTVCPSQAAGDSLEECSTASCRAAQEVHKGGLSEECAATYVSMIVEDLHKLKHDSKNGQAAREDANEDKDIRPANSEHRQRGEDQTVKLELSLPPEIAAQLSAGAQIVFHQENGCTKVEILSLGKQDKVERRNLKVQHRIAEMQTEVPARSSRISDDDMIDSLVQCARANAEGELTTGGGVGSRPQPSRSSDPMPISDLDDALVQALAADACSDKKAHPPSSTCDDADLVAALAGCVAGTGKEAEAHPASRSNSPFAGMVEWFEHSHEDIGHLNHNYLDDDGILEPLI